MPRIGDRASGRAIGKTPRRSYIRVLCPLCRQERWKISQGVLNYPIAPCRQCSLTSLHNKLCGEKHGMWKGGRIFNGHYWNVLIRPSNPLYPMADKYGYVLEHRLVVARHLGRPLESWEIVHHINGDKVDNRMENLELLPNHTDHLSLTMLQREITRLQKEILKWQKLTVWLLRNLGVREKKP